jgi:hypothetical protein
VRRCCDFLGLFGLVVPQVNCIKSAIAIGLLDL